MLSRILPILHRLGFVAGYALALVVHDAKIVLSRGVVLGCRFFIPLHRLGEALGDPLRLSSVKCFIMIKKNGGGW